MLLAHLFLLGTAMSGRRGGKGAAKRYEQWINDPSKVMGWVGKYNLDELLEHGGGLVKIPNFFPGFVAEGMLEVLESIPGRHWNVTEATRDVASNNIAHKFWSSKTAPGVEAIGRAISILQPGRLHSGFSAGKYEQSNHIEPHDDRAYTDVFLDGNVKVKCSRAIAVIYYLTRDWSPSFGGHLKDIATGNTYVPEFNSLIAFRIPRWHEVTAVTAARARYSLFGWFLTEGILYDLSKQDGDGGYGGGTGRMSVRNANGPAGKGPKTATKSRGTAEKLELNRNPQASRRGKSREVSFHGRGGVTKRLRGVPRRIATLLRGMRY